MTTPIINFGEYTVCFEAEEEEMTAREHFIGECGWTEAEFAAIEHFPFFSARVSIFKDGEDLASDYLGCCSYRTVEEFFKDYRGAYFADMVANCVEQIGDVALSAVVEKWLLTVRK